MKSGNLTGGRSVLSAPGSLTPLSEDCYFSREPASKGLVFGRSGIVGGTSWTPESPFSVAGLAGSPSLESESLRELPPGKHVGVMRLRNVLFCLKKSSGLVV